MTRRHPDGPLGASQTERVHVRRAHDAGSLEPFDLVRVVDADADPALAEMALEGTLQRLPDGSELAEPFVFHARSQGLLVLVIPAPARHREREARRELLDELERLERVPAYAFDFRVVVDAAGLRALLPTRDQVAPPPLSENVEDDELVDLSTTALLSDDQLAHLATDLVDYTEASSLDEIQELDADAVEDDGDGDGDAEDATEDVTEDVTEDTHLGATEDTHLSATEGATEDTHLRGTHDLVDAADIEDIEDIEDVEDAEGVELLDDPPAGVLRVQSFLDDGPEYALVDAEWVTSFHDADEEGEDTDNADEAVTLDESDLVVVPESYSALRELPPELPTGVTLPREFAADPRRLRAALFGGRVWLFAKTRPGVFEGGGIDAAVQHVSVGGRSVVLLAVADLRADRSEGVRLAADLASPAPRALLAALARDFVVSVALFHNGSAPTRCIELRSPREDNVARLLARPTRAAPDAVDTATAIARALAAPPPLDSTEHPFQARRAPGSASELRAEVRDVARWLEPSRRDQVRQGLGVPEAVIHQVCEAVIRDALAVGVALPPTLMQWGVSAGLAASREEIVARQLDAFLALTSESERGGLRDSEVDSNWNALSGAAAAFNVPIPAAVREVLTAMDADGLAADPGALEALNVAALLELTRHATHRSASSIELLRRDPAGHADAVGAALRDMRRDEVIALVPALKRAGEGLVPMLLETLAAKKTYVRQAAALTLSSLQAEEAIPGLLELVSTESTSLWEEFARSLAAFGEAAQSAVVSAVEEQRLPKERAALVLAYLAKGGFASNVEELVHHPHTDVAAAAGSVSARLPTVERHLREFYDPSATPTGPREFGRKLFRALHPETVG